MRWKILSTNFLIICTSGESENIGNIDNIENNDVSETIFRANFPNFPIILILTLCGIIENIEGNGKDRETIQKWLKPSFMLQARASRPLDIKSIAHYVKLLVIKRDAMTLRVGLSTFLTSLSIKMNRLCMLTGC